MRRYFLIQIAPGVRVRAYRRAQHRDTFFEGEVVKYQRLPGGFTNVQVLVDTQVLYGQRSNINPPKPRWFPANGKAIEGTDEVNILIEPTDPYEAWKLLYETSRNIPRQTPDGFQNMSHVHFVDYED